MGEQASDELGVVTHIELSFVIEPPRISIPFATRRAKPASRGLLPRQAPPVDRSGGWFMPRPRHNVVFGIMPQ